MYMTPFMVLPRKKTCFAISSMRHGSHTTITSHIHIDSVPIFSCSISLSPCDFFYSPFVFRFTLFLFLIFSSARFSLSHFDR